jgi:hypothetical protein
MPCRFHKRAQFGPERFIEFPMMRGPLVCAVDDFTIDIVLALTGRRITPSNGLGTPVPF